MPETEAEDDCDGGISTTNALAAYEIHCRWYKIDWRKLYLTGKQQHRRCRENAVELPVAEIALRSHARPGEAIWLSCNRRFSFNVDVDVSVLSTAFLLFVSVSECSFGFGVSFQSPTVPVVVLKDQIIRLEMMVLKGHDIVHRVRLLRGAKQDDARITR